MLKSSLNKMSVAIPLSCSWLIVISWFFFIGSKKLYLFDTDYHYTFLCYNKKIKFCNYEAGPRNFTHKLKKFYAF